MLRYEPRSPIVARSSVVRVERRVRCTRVAGRHLQEQAWQRAAAAANHDPAASHVPEARASAGGLIELWRKIWWRAA